MVLLFIENTILQNNMNKQSMKLFDHVVFSDSKYKSIDNLIKIKELWDEIETNFCFVTIKTKL